MNAEASTLVGWPYGKDGAEVATEMKPGGIAFVPAQNNLATALAAAQGQFAQIHRDKTVTVTMKSGGTYTFSYAPMESILRAVTPALAASGLSLTQSVTEMSGKQFVETALLHSSGQRISNHTQIFVNGDGAQAYGSAMTYARRYGVTLLLCICADDDDDDDANAAEGNDAQVVSERKPREDQSSPASGYAKRFVKAIEDGNDDLIVELKDELRGAQELELAIWAQLSAPVRRKIKDVLSTKVSA